MSPEELQDLRRNLTEMRAAAGKGPAGGLGAAAAAAIGGSSVAAAAVAAAKAGVKRKKVGGHVLNWQARGRDDLFRIPGNKQYRSMPLYVHHIHMYDLRLERISSRPSCMLQAEPSRACCRLSTATPVVVHRLCMLMTMRTSLVRRMRTRR
jgi:hypothetical protein